MEENPGAIWSWFPNGDATEPKGKKKKEENKGRADIIRLSGMELFPVNFTVEIKSEEKDITVTVFSRLIVGTVDSHTNMAVTG